MVYYPEGVEMIFGKGSKKHCMRTPEGTSGRNPDSHCGDDGDEFSTWLQVVDVGKGFRDLIPRTP